MHELNLQLPESFFEEEVRSNYTVSSDMKKIWAVELDLLNECIRLCDKYKIKYYACAGTLLGAIRHGGFIPWDDDIDIIMSRKDYQRFCEIAEKEFRYPYFFQTDETDPGSTRGHAQLRNSATTGILKDELEYRFPYNQGIFIDIFPYDHVPDRQKERRKLGKRVNRYIAKAKQYSYCYYGINTSKGMKRFFRFFSMLFFKITYRGYDNKYFKKAELEKQKYNQSGKDKISNLCIGAANVERFTIKEEWCEKTELKPFEMLQISVPAGYKKILKRNYGDWEIFSVGTTIHGGVVFDTEKSYADYFKRT